MFVILLKFSTNREKAGQYMEEHKAWISQGIRDGVFLVVGSLTSGGGGGIVAMTSDADLLQQRVNQDPFVQYGVVEAEMIEMTPSYLDERLLMEIDE